MLSYEFIGLTWDMLPLMTADSIDIRCCAEQRLEIEPIGVVDTLLNLTLVGDRVAKVRNTRTLSLTLYLRLLLCRYGQNEA